MSIPLDQPNNVETYEQLFTELEQVVARLERGELALEEALQLYERGSQLAITCQDLLDRAELRIREVRVTGEFQIE